MVQYFKNKWFQSIFLACLAVLLYANTITHSYVIDDRIVVTHNKLTQQGVSAIPAIFSHSYLFGYDGREDESYRPITLTTFAIERSLFNANPTFSHLIQILLYACCVVVLLKFLKRLFNNSESMLPFVIALLFVVHPIHTEVVANVKSRDEILGALFLFASWSQFLQYYDENKKNKLFLSMICLFLACLSKDSAVAGIGIFPFLPYFFRKEKIGRSLLKSGLLLTSVLLYFLIRFSVLSNVLISHEISPVANSLALNNDIYSLYINNFSIFTKYIQLCFFPINLSWDYSIAQFPQNTIWSITSVIGVLFFIVFILILLFYGFSRRKIVFGGILFLCMFALTSNFFFLINCTLGERFMFLPVLGILFMVVVALKSISPKIAWFLVLGVGILYSAKTFTRNFDWKNNLTIYRAGVEVCPNSVKTHFNLGTEYIEQGHEAKSELQQIKWYKLAESELLRCVEIYPAYDMIYQNIGYVYGELARLTKDSTKSHQILTAGIKLIDSANNRFHFNNDKIEQNLKFLRQRALVYSDNIDEKRKLIMQLQKNTPSNTVKSLEDYKTMAYYHKKLNQMDSVLLDYKELLKHYPNQKTFLKEIARIYFMQKEYALSLSFLERYTAAFPNDWSAQTNRAMLLELTGKRKEALKHYEFILEKSPNQQNAKKLYEQLKKKLNE